MSDILNKNLYYTLGVTNLCNIKDIKKSYYKLSFKYHPDRGGSDDQFALISEAWEVLSDEKSKEDYDRKSKFGKDYNELEEFFKIDMEYNHKEAESNFDKVKKREVLDIVVTVDINDFDGNIEFARLVHCKKCKGTGKDTSTKIAIKNDKGEVKYFEADDGCDFCEGSGKSWTGQDCAYCAGKGKVGLHDCKDCKGERRILGKQKLSGIKLEGDETKIEAMGNISYYDQGRVGMLIIRKK